MLYPIYSPGLMGSQFRYKKPLQESNAPLSVVKLRMNADYTGSILSVLAYPHIRLRSLPFERLKIFAQLRSNVPKKSLQTNS